MNSLYAILVKNSPVDGRFGKLFTPVKLTDKGILLQNGLLEDIPDNDLPRFACLVCGQVKYSVFFPEMLGLDPVNTFRDIPDSLQETRQPVCGMLKPKSGMLQLHRWLDSDILDRLVNAQWIDEMGACCLQLLREVRNV